MTDIKIEIISPDGLKRIKLNVDDSSFRSKKLMVENILSLEFSATNRVVFEEGCWCMFKQEKYTLLKNENFKKLSERNFSYSLLLDAEEGKTKDVKYKLFTLTRNAGQPPIVDSPPKISFPLVATPREFMQLMADNMNIANNETGWEVGDCIEAEPMLIDFNDMYCFDVLGILADKFKTEWEIESVGDKKLMHLCKIEKLKDSAINLGYGYGMGFEPGLGRSNFDSKVINRLYINSSDRNIDFETYGSTNLLMPKNKVIEHEGIKYKTDSGGFYIERAERKGRVCEGSLDVSEIYPMREGTVTAVDEASFAKNIYYIYDDTIPDTLNFSKCIIPGTTMNIIFQTGDLTGIELDASYNHLKRRIEVIQKTNNGISYPDKNLLPRVGDKYGLFNIKLPSDYITDAEDKILKKAVENLYESEKPKYTFYGTLDRFFAEKRWGDIGGFLNVGYYVRFFDPHLSPDGELIRIVEVKEYVNRPYQPEISLANNTSGKAYTNQQNKLNNQEQTIDRSKKESIDYTKRSWRDSKELIEAVKGMVDDFENSRLSAEVFEGMMALFGSENLQFQFLADNWVQAISPYISYDPVMKQIKCGAAKVQHMTMGIDSVQPNRDISKYKFWTAPEYTSAVLTDSDQPYFLYLQASKAFSTVNGRNVGEATFFISKDKIKIDDIPNYNVFWVGYLNSENMEGNRSFRTMYGYTEILPGQITVDKLLSTSGDMVIDLLNSTITAKNGATIQGNIKFLSNGTYKDVAKEFADTNKKVDDSVKVSEDAKAAAEALEYIKKALANRTEIDGGLLLTSLLKLGVFVGDVFKEKAGINGTAQNPEDVAFWINGTLQEAIQNLASIIFRMDGSGHLAKGNIKWDANGNPTVLGEFIGKIVSTDKFGNKIILDADNYSFSFQDKDGRKLAEWYYRPDVVSGGSYLEMYRYNNSGELEFQTLINGQSIQTQRLNPDGSGTTACLFNADGDYGNIINGENLSVFNLPTSPYNLPRGRLWRNGKAIEVIP